MSFETEFFGPGNRLRWEAIQAGSLPADVLKRLRPFIEDLRDDRDVVALPRVREEGGEVVWYVLCSSPRTARLARDEVQAFLGTTYSNFEGRPTQLNPNDPVERAVLAKFRNNAFRVEIPSRNLIETARERFGLMISLGKERPRRERQRRRPAGRVLRDFEYALLTNQERTAADCIEELRSAGQLNEANLLFLEVRRLAVGQHWDGILALPELEMLLNLVRPRRVTEALIRAVYFTSLKEFEDSEQVERAVHRFRSEIWPRFRNLYQTHANLFGFEVDASFLLAAACMPRGPELGRGVLESYPAESPARAYLTRLLEFTEGPRPVPAVNLLADTRKAFGEGEIDRAYEMAVNLVPSYDRCALLLRCAHEMSTLASAQVALESVELLSVQDRARLDHSLLLSRIRDSLTELSAVETQTAIAQRPTEAIPSSWPEWLKRLLDRDSWKGAVFVAETGAREWSIETFLKDSNMVAETADLLLHDRPEWGQEALRDALPYFVEFCISTGADVRLKALYESLFLVIAIDPQVSLPQTSALIRIAHARLELGPSKAQYVEILEHMISALHATESPSVADTALEALEMLVTAACADVQQRRQFAIQVIAIFQRWYQRIDRAQFVLLRALTTELEIAGAIGDLATIFAERTTTSEWEQLQGKRIAVYSLQESALRRAALVIGQLSPGSRVDTFSDHVGGSPALRKAAATADLFILATAAAKHAATTFIEARRPKNLPTLYARGQGSASLLHAVAQYLHRIAV